MASASGEKALAHSGWIALDIVKEQFGDAAAVCATERIHLMILILIVQTIVGEILRRGRMYIAELVKYTRLKLAVIQRSLFALVQHNCVYVTEEVKGEEKVPISSALDITHRFMSRSFPSGESLHTITCH